MAKPNAGNRVNIEKVPFTCYFGASVIGNELRAQALKQMSGTERDKLLRLNDLDRLEVSLAGANAAAACEAEKSCFVVDRGNIKGAAAAAVFDDFMKGSFKVVGPLDDGRVQQMQEWADQHCRVATLRSVAGNTVKNEETVSCSSAPVSEGESALGVQTSSHSTSGHSTAGMAKPWEAFDRISRGIRERHDKAAERIEKNFDRRAAEMQKRFDETSSGIDRNFDETEREMDRRFDEDTKEMDRRFDEATKEMDRRFDEATEEIDRNFDGVVKVTDAKETPKETLARLSGDMASALVAAGETAEDASRLIAGELAGSSDTASKLEALGRMAETASSSGYGDKLAELKKLPRFSKDAKALDVEIKIATARVKGKNSPFARRVIAVNSLYERHISIK